MDGAHGAVGRRGQDAIAVLAAPPVIEAGHIERILLRQSEQILPFPAVPLVKARGRDQAAPHPHAVPEQGFFSGRLRSGVDDQGSGQLVSPLHEPRRDLAAGFRQHRRVGGRADLPGRPLASAVFLLDCFDDLPNFFALLCRKLIPSTHLWGLPCNKLYAAVQNIVYHK